MLLIARKVSSAFPAFWKNKLRVESLGCAQLRANF
jgi:hypothetical protein